MVVCELAVRERADDVTVAALVYLYLRHNRNFYFVRNMFMVAMAIALVGYAVFPTAPPRFMPEWGFIDTRRPGHRRARRCAPSAAMSALINLYAAVPSMHVAFALMIGWPLARLVRWRVPRVLWLLYPFLMAFVIIVTANHFIVDAAARRADRGRVRVRRELAGACASGRVALLDRHRAAERERLARRADAPPPGNTARHAAAAVPPTERRRTATRSDRPGSVASSSATG